MGVVTFAQVFDAVNHRDGEKDHHGKPHADVVIEISDSFSELRQFGDREEHASNYCIN
jgi:hypothetical protein